jgi:hypothetical protein
MIGFTLTAQEEKQKVNSSDFKVFPTPATNKLNVEFNNLGILITRIAIYNQLGKVIFESKHGKQDGAQTTQIDISHFKKGMYLIKVRHGKDILMIKKFLKN